MKSNNLAFAILVALTLILTILVLGSQGTITDQKHQIEKLQASETKAKQRADFYQWRDQHATGHTVGPSSYPGEWRP